MLAQDDHPEPATAAEAHAARQDANTRWYLQTLHGLIAMGAELAREVHADATGPAPGPDPDSGPDLDPGPGPGIQSSATTGEPPAAPPFPRTADPTAAFSRIALCVRRTVLLAQHLNALPLASLAHAQGAAEAATADEAARQAALRHRLAARKRILRAVEDNIVHDMRKPQAETLQRELLERLEAPELDEEIATRPIGDIISDLLDDFGLYGRMGKRRTPDDATLLHARAAKPPPITPPGPARPGIPGRGQRPVDAAPAGDRPDEAVTLLLHPARARGKPCTGPVCPA